MNKKKIVLIVLIIYIVGTVLVFSIVLFTFYRTGLYLDELDEEFNCNSFIYYNEDGIWYNNEFHFVLDFINKTNKDETISLVYISNQYLVYEKSIKQDYSLVIIDQNGNLYDTITINSSTYKKSTHALETTLFLRCGDIYYCYEFISKKLNEIPYEEYQKSFDTEKYYFDNVKNNFEIDKKVLSIRNVSENVTKTVTIEDLNKNEIIANISNRLKYEVFEHFCIEYAFTWDDHIYIEICTGSHCKYFIIDYNFENDDIKIVDAFGKDGVEDMYGFIYNEDGNINILDNILK